MYTTLSDNKTQQYYKKIVDDTLLLSKKQLEEGELYPWNSIVNQLKDIQAMVIENYSFADWEEIHDRYTLGTLAVRDFPEGDEMQLRLCDIFWGAVHYQELEEKEV